MTKLVNGEREKGQFIIYRNASNESHPLIH